MAKPGGMMLAIGFGKPRGRGSADPEAPGPVEGTESPRHEAREAPEEEAKEHKLTPEDIGYVYPDQHCSNCEYFSKRGECLKYDLAGIEPEGGCVFGFSPRMDEEPDEGMGMDNEAAEMPQGA